MCGRWSMAAIGLLACASIGAQPRPAAEEQARTLAIARDTALHYARTLPDFMCTEIVERSWMPSSFEQAADKLTFQLTYFEQKEKYKLLAIDGAPTDRTYESLQGLISGGEFGSMLVRIFDPASAAEFRWKGWTTIAKRKAALYSYRVQRTHSHHTVGYRTASGEMRTAVVAHQGTVALDSETSRVLRITLEAVDIPADFKMLKSSNTVEYGFVDIAGRSNLLPLRAESVVTRPSGSTPPRPIAKASASPGPAPPLESRNVVSFVEYRKFSADSSITFDSAGKKK